MITQLTTKTLFLNLLTREETLAMVEAMSPEERAQVSPSLSRLEVSPSTADDTANGYDNRYVAEF